MNRIDLDGKIAVVTGGAQGIGRAVAERFIASGARVVLWDRDQALVEQTAQAIGATGTAIDVTDAAAVAAAVEAQGQIDIFINNAGIAGPSVKTWDYPIDTWRQVIELDLNAALAVAAA